MAGEERARVLDAQVALDEGLEQVAEGTCQRDEQPEHEAVDRPDDVLPVQHPPHHDRADHHAGDEPLDGLAGRDRRRQLAPPDQAADRVGADVGGPRAEQHGEDEREGVVAQHHDGAEPDADPDHAEDGQRHARQRRVVLVRRCRGEDEREEDDGAEHEHHALHPAQVRRQHFGRHADVPREHDGTMIPRDRPELVHGEHARHDAESDQPPLAEPERGDRDRQQDDRDEDAAGEIAHR